ncbi:hypothetical protein [Mesorhizobium sp. B2-4-6]|uniref:hypothetical protein n=1 Tax=Mesorhizobium sp. B2-4-6 TaxID=2589943 RepID=UPI0011271D03|nr:hypothetical protein [Mesorhizobium sp. B2-4-6]TPL40658.1 hypothetical protein FJ957_25855 [Mesorhizobium sp. B2-4-6]
MKADGDDTPPRLTEPEPLPSVFVTGFAIQVSEEHVTRLVFWTDLPEVGDRDREARIQARLAMPDKTFRRLMSEGRRLSRSGQ